MPYSTGNISFTDNLNNGKLKKGRPRKGGTIMNFNHPSSGHCDDTITEDFKVSTDVVFRELGKSSTMEYIFPETLSGEQRKYIHMKCRTLGFNSKSQGKEPRRQLRVWRSNKTYQKVFHLECSNNIENVIDSSLVNLSLLSKERPQHNYYKSNSYSQNDQVFGRISCGNIFKVPRAVQNNFMEFRQQLPIWSKRREIINILQTTQVLLISAETGSGKTTQVPQFIIEDACTKGDYCKVICTQPRRLSTIAVAERVAAERGEKIGNTVGYQIKLETKLGLKSAIIYCTNGILLRTLMNANSGCLKTITHIIVDEIHERDKYTDFVLISLRQSLLNNPHLKLILMSATGDVRLFMSYFKSPYLLYVPGKLFNIHELFVEDILPMVNESHNTLEVGGIECNQTLYNIDEWKSENCSDNIVRPSTAVSVTDSDLIEDMNNCINRCVLEGTEEIFQELMILILSENGSVSHKTAENSYTPLIAAAMHGKLEIVRQLLHLGADPSVRSGNLNAAEWAHHFSKFEVRDLLNTFNSFNESSDVHYQDATQKYIDASGNAYIDYSLIVKIVKKLHICDKYGTVLIFLPGYNEIIECKQNILNTTLNPDDMEIFMLHSSLNIKAQHRVFEKLPNKQKIILSTNIAETSITISDVVYVIDTGKEKIKTYDMISGISSLVVDWVSKASVKQRAGRAGRTRDGVCFHLFSRKRFVALANNCIPEILRIPLHELCLQTKLLAPSSSSIADYLKQALEPPPILSVKHAIEGLKRLGALKENEELTPLGEHLVQLSVEPRLGKMLLYAVIFKCLDPILTIVASLACKDPFVLPLSPNERKAPVFKLKQLSSQSLSDHLTFLRAYQIWEQDTRDYQKYMQQFYINTVTMHVIHETRSQLLSQLRAAGFIKMQKPFTIHDANINSASWPIIKGVLTIGCYPNIAFGQNNTFTTRFEKKVSFHKSSCLEEYNSHTTEFRNLVSDYCVIYEELFKDQKCCKIKCGTVVTPFTVALLCGDEKIVDSNSIVIDEYLYFQHSYKNFSLFCIKLKEIIAHKIIIPSYRYTVSEENLLNAVIQTLILEEEKFGLLCQPIGVGLPPRLCTNYQGHFNGFSPHSKSHLKGENSNLRECKKKTYNYFKTSPSQSLSGQNNQRKWYSYTWNNFNATKSADNIHIRQAVDNLTDLFFNRLNTETLPNAALVDTSHLFNLQENVSTKGLVANDCNNLQNAAEAADTSNDRRSELLLSALVGSSVLSTRISTKALNNNDILPPTNLNLPHNTVFYVIKPPEQRCFRMGISRGTWVFAPHTERKIFRQFTEGKNVILFYTINKTQEFQGLARLGGLSISENNLTCPVKWLSTKIVPYKIIKSRNIVNSFNGNLWVFQCLDGQEVEYGAGYELFKLFFDESIQGVEGFSRAILGNQRL